MQQDMKQEECSVVIINNIIMMPACVPAWVLMGAAVMSQHARCQENTMPTSGEEVLKQFRVHPCQNNQK